jgi:hypothetical protein
MVADHRQGGKGFVVGWWPAGWAEEESPSSCPLARPQTTKHLDGNSDFVSGMNEESK